MSVEIVAIGHECSTEQVVDARFAWIRERFHEIGLKVERVTSVFCCEKEIVDTVSEAMERADVVLFCQICDTLPPFDLAFYERIERILDSKYAAEGSGENDAATSGRYVVFGDQADSVSANWFECHGKVLISLSGNLQEMESVVSKEICSRLNKKGENRSFTACGDEKEKVENVLITELDKQKNSLGEMISSEGQITLVKLAARLLQEAGLTISTAESCTGGRLASQFTSLPGSSAYYMGGVVAYSNNVKMNFLGVLETTLKAHGAVSEPTVVEMMKGVMARMNTDCAIATSGVAGPDGGTSEKPVGTVWIAVGYKDVIHTFKQTVNHGRLMNIERACDNALLLLIDLIKIRKN